MSKSIELEILEYNYWEHFKYAKDIALILPLDDLKRIKVETELNKLSQDLQFLKLKENGALHK